MQNDFKKDRPYNKDGKKQFKKRWSRQDFYVPGRPNAVKVPDASAGALEKSLRYLKRQMKDTDVIGQVRARQEFTKPSVVKRKKMKDAKRKQWVCDQITKKFWKDHVWLVPVPKGYGPNLPD
jgi:small subunit ribosomal protein S21